MATFVDRLWRGDVPLVKVFWHYAVVYGLLVNLITSALFMVLLINDAPWALLALAYLSPLPYNLLVTVSVWRSADRYEGPRHHGDLARAGVIVWMVLLTAT